MIEIGMCKEKRGERETAKAVNKYSMIDSEECPFFVLQVKQEN